MARVFLLEVLKTPAAPLARGKPRRAFAGFPARKRLHAAAEFIGESSGHRQGELFVGARSLVPQAELRHLRDVAGERLGGASRFAFGHDAIGKPDALGLSRADGAP